MAKKTPTNELSPSDLDAHIDTLTTPEVNPLTEADVAATQVRLTPEGQARVQQIQGKFDELSKFIAGRCTPDGDNTKLGKALVQLDIAMDAALGVLSAMPSMREPS